MSKNRSRYHTAYRRGASFRSAPSNAPALPIWHGSTLRHFTSYQIASLILYNPTTLGSNTQPWEDPIRYRLKPCRPINSASHVHPRQHVRPQGRRQHNTWADLKENAFFVINSSCCKSALCSTASAWAPRAQPPQGMHPGRQHTPETVRYVTLRSADPVHGNSTQTDDAGDERERGIGECFPRATRNTHDLRTRAPQNTHTHNKTHTLPWLIGHSDTWHVSRL